MSLICRFFGHALDRDGVEHDGHDFWTSCKRCDSPMIREADGWRTGIDEEVQLHIKYLVEGRVLLRQLTM